MANLHGKDGSFLILFKDDRKREVFLIFRTDYPIWVLTGGGIELGETPKEAALREAKEETGFKVKTARYVGKYEYQTKNTYLFEGRYVSGAYRPEFKGNIGKWFPVQKLPLDLTSSTRKKIMDAVNSDKEPFVHKIEDELPFISNLRLFFRHPLPATTFIFKNFFRKTD